MFCKLNKIIFSLPNLAKDDVPIGNDEKSNKLIKQEGNLKKFSLRKINEKETVKNLIKVTGFDFDVDNKISQMCNPDTYSLNILRDKIAPMVSEFYPEFANRIWGI